MQIRCPQLADGGAGYLHKKTPLPSILRARACFCSKWLPHKTKEEGDFSIKELYFEKEL